MSEKKIQKPVVDEHYVRPQAAWEKMKAARSMRQTVYLYVTTGTGKTTFVMDFLGRRRCCYASVADTGIEEISGMVPGKSETYTIFVIDDLYLLETEEDRSACGKLIEDLSARKDIWLILISRAPMPKWLKTAFIRYIFVTIGEEELCLSQKEQEQYLEKWELAPQQITKKKEAGKLIRQAQETGNFLIEYRENDQSIYEMRTPMKYSMRRRLEAKYSQDYIMELYYSAGNSYEIAGNVREALKMYETCHNEDGISRILIDNARRNSASGEYFELRRYYLALPEEKIFVSGAKRIRSWQKASERSSVSCSENMEKVWSIWPSRKVFLKKAGMTMRWQPLQETEGCRQRAAEKQSRPLWR